VVENFKFYLRHILFVFKIFQPDSATKEANITTVIEDRRVDCGVSIFQMTFSPAVLSWRTLPVARLIRMLLGSSARLGGSSQRMTDHPHKNISRHIPLQCLGTEGSAGGSDWRVVCRPEKTMHDIHEATFAERSVS